MRRKQRLLALALLALFASLAPATARAELMIPVTVRIDTLVQTGDVDTLPVPNLGDFFVEVSIDGQTFDNHDEQCENAGTAGYITPYVFFAPGGISDPSCPGEVPWTFQADVPLSALTGDGTGTGLETIPVRMRLMDDDTISDDTVVEIQLDVAFGGRWSGGATWPERCAANSKATFCWLIDVGQDTDGDGLLDDWEANGLDADGDGTIDLDLPAMGANPMHKDLFVELDWRQGYPPKRAELQKVREAFANAPADAGGVLNPDGMPGINLHIDTGSLTEGGVLVGDDLGGGNELPANVYVCELDGVDYGLYAAKKNHFDAAKRGLVFRYGVVSTNCCMYGPDAGKACFIDSQCTNAVCQKYGGRAEIGGNDFVTWAYESYFGSTLMHELGHTLNLRHGGASDDNCKPNYLSIMNYDHWVIQRLDGSEVLDFSPPRRPNGTRGTAPLGPLSEDVLDETGPVMDPADDDTLLRYVDSFGSKRQSPVGLPIDWNGDGDKNDADLAVNVDTVGAAGTPENCKNSEIRGETHAQGPLLGHDDWARVSLSFLQFGDSADGPLNPVEDPEPRVEEIRQTLEEVNTADLAVAKTGDPGPYEAGSDVTLDYTIDAKNEGPNPALPLLVEDALPAGATLASADSACEESEAGKLSCRFDGVLPGETRQVALSLQVRASCAGGLPVAIVNEASVRNGSPHAGPDPDPADDTASFTTQVVDTTPPTLAVSASPSKLWAPDHTFVPITVSVTTTDVCDDSPDVRLVSVTSNEGTLADGSGHTSPDVRGASFGTDDRTFELRAERRGPGGGRVYTVTYEAADASGNVATATTTVTVVKSQTKR